MREAEARRVAERSAAGAQLVEDRRVLRLRGHDRDAPVVLGGRPDHRGAADVDLLDRFDLRHAGPRHRLLEGIEGDDDQIDRCDPVLAERGEMLGDITAGQDSAVDLRMERLDAPVEHLGETGRLRHVDHADPRLADQLRRAAGRQDLDAETGQSPRELDDPGLVVHADERPADLHGLPRTVTLRPSMARRPSANRRTASG